MLFSKEEINTGRQLGIDFAKAFAIFFMVLSHPFEYTDLDITTGLAYRIMFIGSHQFAAPIFMLAMGIGFTFSRNSNDPKKMLHRGWNIFKAGILLNIVRSLAASVAFLATKNPEMLHLGAMELVVVDIFQLAGLATMLFAALQMLSVPYWGILVLSVAMSLIGTQIHMFTSGNYLLDWILALFIGVCNDYSVSYFPLLNWFVFIVVGYGMGRLLRRCVNPNKFFAILTPIVAVLYWGYFSYAAPRGIGMFNTETTLHFYQIRAFDVIISMFAALMIFGIGHFVMPLLFEWLKKQITRIASDLMRIYVLQWLIITWIVNALVQEILGVEYTVTTIVIAGLCVLIASVLLARVKPFSKMKI